MISATKRFLYKHQKYIPIAFFTIGFIWDSFTLRRIDGWYSNFILLTYMTSLTISIYVFNMSDDDWWDGTFLEPYEEYAPLAVQFFLGGLCSSYVIFFFESVSLTKTMVFFIILVFLFLANEVFKHRISNKYLQFGGYFFVNFTFFTFFIPIVIGAMNTIVFAISGLISLGATLYLIQYIYRKSPSTRKEVSLPKLAILIVSIYILINMCYYFNLIPPVPLALESGLVAYHVDRVDDRFNVTYEQTPYLTFWKSFDATYNYTPGDTVFVYTSIFAPTYLRKSIYHKWQWYDPDQDIWNTTDRIGYEVRGGREGGYRGYTFKNNIWPGRWRVDVITNEGLVLGEIDFQVIPDSTKHDLDLVDKEFD